jgi:hypothetical protein
MPGPVPMRVAELNKHSHRVNDQVDTVKVDGEVPVPDLNIPDAHDIVLEMWEAAKNSAQKRYYEPTDWQQLRLVLVFADKLLKSSRPSGQMLAVVHSMLGDLLTSEGSRRRLRIEVERRVNGEPENVLDVAAMFKQRLATAN